jgi:hypothetical protein
MVRRIAERVKGEGNTLPANPDLWSRFNKYHAMRMTKNFLEFSTAVIKKLLKRN